MLAALIVRSWTMQSSLYGRSMGNGWSSDGTVREKFKHPCVHISSRTSVNHTDFTDGCLRKCLLRMWLKAAVGMMSVPDGYHSRHWLMKDLHDM